MSDDELTKPLMGDSEEGKEGEEEEWVEESEEGEEGEWYTDDEEEGEEDDTFKPQRVGFAPVVRASDVEYPLDGPKTISIGKKKKVRKTRFGPSTKKKIYRLPRGFWQSRHEQDKAIDEKKNETNCFGEWSMDNVNGDKKSCCGENCVVSGGKKTKRRRYTRKYTKKHRSRKSRRSKKGSKNNKKK